MRGEQGPSLLHVPRQRKKGVYKGLDGPESLTCRGLQVLFYLFILNLLDFLCVCESISCLEPPNGLTFYGEAPQLFIPRTILLVSFLALTLSHCLHNTGKGLGVVFSVS